jgi:hypothetical protein
MGTVWQGIEDLKNLQLAESLRQVTSRARRTSCQPTSRKPKPHLPERDGKKPASPGLAANNQGKENGH